MSDMLDSMATDAKGADDKKNEKRILDEALLKAQVWKITGFLR